MGMTGYLRARSNAKRIGALWRTLEASATPSARPGSSLNQFGQYWADSAVDELAEAFRATIATEEDADERKAAKFSLASLMRSSLRLEAALEVCDEALEGDPNQVNFLRVLAEVKACRGELSEALRICELIPNLPHGRAFRIDPDTLRQLAPKETR